MKPILYLLLLFPFLLHSQEISLSSPDGNMILEVHTNGKLSWSVKYKGTPVIEQADISMTLDGNRVLGARPQLVKQSTEFLQAEIQPVVPNKDAHIADVCNQLTLQFKKGFKVVFRAYDEGVAYQFQDNIDKPGKVITEQLEVRFPANTTSYFPKEETMYSHFERDYIFCRLDTLASKDFCSLPVLINTENSAKVLITEAALHDYPAMFFRGNGNNSVTAIFPKYVLEAKPNADFWPDRNQLITQEAEYIAQTTGKRAFPWRVFMISDDDRTFVESNLVFQLSRPCALENTDWIKPGKVAWDWYNANNIFGVDFESGLNTETYKYYIDFASENGIEYVILDEGWTQSTTEILGFNPDMDVAALIEYGQSKNVGIILWVLWKPLAENMTEILETYKSWGARGIKVDFMQRADQGMVSSYEAIAKEAARLELLVDYHGAFKPAGLRRIYPNVLSYEGVKGSEQNKWSATITPEHNVTLPFIRMAAGPMDYTPGAMRNAGKDNYAASFTRPMSLGTRCHQVAMYVVFESPLQMMCENPSIYRKEQETVDFIAQVPTTWDETRVLQGAVGDYIAVARRKGDRWYIGAMTDWSARDLELDLSFLPEGSYQLELMRDGVNAGRHAEDYKRETLQVDKSAKLNIHLAPGGGWAGILTERE